MIGRILPAVTLEQRGTALTTNFLKVQLAHERAPNQMLDLEIGALSEMGLQERTALQVL